MAWQFPETLSKVQVVVLRDPAGEQEARFDLLHGASSVLRTVLATLLRPATWLAAGIRTSGRTVRLAVAMPSSNFPSGKVEGGFNSDYIWRNLNFHLGSSELLDGISSRAFVWFVIAGPWTNALAFAQNLTAPGAAKGVANR